MTPSTYVLTTEARDQSQASPRGMYGGQRGTGTGCSPNMSFLSHHYHPPVRHVYFSLTDDIDLVSCQCR